MSYDAEMLQFDIEGRLNSWPYFIDIKVNADEPGIVMEDVIKALGPLNKKNGKCGAFVLVMMPEEDVISPDSAEIELRVQMAVHVFTNGLINKGPSGTKKSNAQIRREIRRALHLWSPNGSNEITCDGQCGTQIASLKDKGGNVVGYELVFNMNLPDGWIVLPSPPRIALAGALPEVSATLSQSEGAEIRYTLDGSFPGPQSDLYDAPLTLTEPCQIRAAAYAAGLGSSITQKTIE